MEQVDLLIEHGHIIALDAAGRRIPDGTIAVRGDRIVAMAPGAQLRDRFSADRTIDASERYVFPGLINTHIHSFQTLLKGLGRDRPLLDWLAVSIRPVAPRLDAESTYLGAAVAAIESIRSGVTTVVDYNYAHPRPHLADAAIEAFAGVGVRSVYARSFSDRAFGEGAGPLVEPPAAFLADIDRLAAKYDHDDMVDIWVSPSAFWNMTEQGLKETAEYAADRGLAVTMHIDETVVDDQDSLARFGRKALPYLADIGLVNERFLGVHCVHLDAEDIEVLRRNGAKVSHNPVSNMLLGTGVSPVHELMKAGITVGLGTDGAASNDSQDMLETMKIVALLQKVTQRDPSVVGAEQVVRMATLDGARALGKESLIGSLEVGKAADLFIYDPWRAKSSPLHDPLSSLVYSSGESNIRTTIVAGRVVLDDGVVAGVDEGDVLRRAQRAANDLVSTLRR
ncbi:MAG: amidohydrolase family protein [Bacillota bacterium]